MKNRFLKRTLAVVLSVYTLLATVGIPVSAEAGAASSENIECAPVLSENVKVSSRLYELLFGKGSKSSEPMSLVVGGDVFGVKIRQKYVTVTEAKGVPALKAGDVILSVNGEKVSTAADVKRLISKSGGESVTIRALHGGSEVGVEVRPTLDSGEYKLGLSLRDGAAGLGTVTFIDKKTGLFGGLGHGICDSESGDVIMMESGEVCGVILGGVHKGECGKPGELCGILTDSDLGDLNINSECGVFGIITDPQMLSGSELEIAQKSEVKEGEATIISTIKNGKTAEYKIEIYDIDQNSNGSKSFRIRVTDEALKAITGGIVRGMSGSPIIQNGKLVGAVTHVMVADPTEGYGIFIENMLSAAGQIALPKAA
ncbi:MAG: PDZ domain-containing protein [Ruminococcaceae bacterium]|nr:PDZ domain-containing protein [Oscillospiraceae bacterium]